MEQRRRWEEMDADCLINIFRRLSLEDLTVGVPFVCRSWSKASLDPLCWQILNFQPLDFMPWSKFAKRFTACYSVSPFSFRAFLRFAIRRACGLAVQLQFHLFSRTLMNDLVYVANECPRLKLLVLPNLASEIEVCIPELIGELKDLERLEMKSKPSSFPELVKQISINCARFSGLRISGSITKEDALAIVNYLPKIECLDLSNSYLPKEVLLVIVHGCKGLQRLSVSNCIGFEADDKEIIKRASGVKVFEHEGSKLREDFGYETDESDPLHVIVI